MHWLAALLLAFWLPSVADAHGQLQDAEPAADSLLDESPPHVMLEFNEPVSPVRMRWFGPAGEVQEAEAEAEDLTIFVSPPTGFADGTRLLSWRVVSSDGHPVGGTYVFSVGHVTEVPKEVDGAGASGLAAMFRAALTVALAVAAGGAAFHAVVAPIGPGRRAVIAAAAILLPLSVLALGVQGVDLLGLRPGAILSAAPWRAALGGPFALTCAATFVAGVLALLALTRRDRAAARTLGVLAWAAAAVSFTLSGHVVTADPRWLARLLIGLHALSLIYWMGALLPLLAAVGTPDANAVVARFSRLAIPLVALLGATGIALAWLQSRDIGLLAGSTYGSVLGVKLALFAVLLGLAAWNRLRLTPDLVEGRPTAPKRLSASIRREMVLGLLIIALASSFRLTPPPRALAAAAPEDLMLHLHDPRAMAMLTLTPGRVGRNEVQLSLQDGDGAPLRLQTAELRAALPERELEPQVLAVEADQTGDWTTRPLLFPVPGTWAVELRLRISDFEQITLSTTLDVVP